MAFTATAIGRVRTGGNDANGAFYDSGIASAGTDYSQQDSPQLSVTDIACAANTTVTSVTGGFTTAMIGNAIRITGGGATSGYYFITARTDTNTVTVDRTPGTVVAGTGKVGGGALTWQALANSSNAAGNKVVAGNTIYILGTNSDTPSAADYTFTGVTTCPNGDGTSGHVKIIGEQIAGVGRPRLQGNGNSFGNSQYLWLENLYLTTSSNNSGTNGLCNPGVGGVVKNCVMNTNNKTSMVGINAAGNNCLIIDTEVLTDTTSPTTNSGSHAIATSGLGTRIIGCYIHHARDDGIKDTGGATIIDCQIVNNVGIGVEVTTGSSGATIKNNTIDNNQGHGISFNQSAAMQMAVVMNNLITNQSQSGKKGINAAAGTTALNDFMKMYFDYNYFYNNTANVGTVSTGTHDDTTTGDPGYVSTSGNNYAIGTAAKAKGWPGLFRNSSTTGYTDPGAAQRQEPTAVAGSSIIHSASTQY